MNFLAQLPELEPWKQSRSSLDEAVEDFCNYNRRVAHLLCALPILWPDFVVIDDLLLRKDAVPQAWSEYKEMAAQADWSPSQIEYVLNHIHLSDLFLNDLNYDQIKIETLDFLASTIAEMWRTKLKSLFPERPVVVEVNEMGISPEVCVYTLR